MSNFQRILPAALVFALCGCSSVQISSQYDHSANFSHLKTYAWVPGAQTGLEDPRINAKFVDPHVRKDVDAALTAKGYTKQPIEAADFLVSYHVSLQDESTSTKMTDAPIYDEYDVSFDNGQKTVHSIRDASNVSYLDSFQVGTLLLRITDAKSKKLIWHGAAEAQLADNSTVEQKKQRLDRAIQRILERFPPK